MISYLLKRLISMVVTLFLISIVVFLILSLSPIDPAQMALKNSSAEGGQQSAQEDTQGAIQEMREHYNLDMPWLFNFDVQDKTKITKKIISGLTTKPPVIKDEEEEGNLAQNDTVRQAFIRKRGLAKKSLERMGSAVYTEMARFLEKNAHLPTYANLMVPLADTFYPRKTWEDVDFKKLGDKKLSAFMQASERLFLFRKKLAEFSEISKDQLKEVANKIDKARESFLQWWKENQKNFQEKSLEDLATALLSDDSKNRARAGGKLKSLGRIIAPYLIGYILTPSNYAKQSKKAENLRLESVEIMARVTGKRYTYSPDSPPEAKAKVVRSWKRWWERHDKYFVALGAGKKFVRTFTHTQYATWMSRLIHLDFGKSWEYKRPVVDVILERIPISLQLALPSLLLVYLLAIPLGVFSATYRDTFQDRFLTVVLFILYSLPTFWIGLLLIQTLTSGPLGFFPTGGLSSTGYEQLSWYGQIIDRIRHLALPLFCMSYGGLAYISRQMRASMLESINQDFTRTARAKGLKGQVVIWKHVFWNSTIPILTLLAGLLPVLMGGSVIIEVIFSIQGMGMASFSAAIQSDRPMLMAIMFCYAVLILIGILLVDIAYAFVDPRISYD